MPKSPTVNSVFLYSFFKSCNVEPLCMIHTEYPELRAKIVIVE